MIYANESYENVVAQKNKLLKLRKEAEEQFNQDSKNNLELEQFCLDYIKNKLSDEQLKK